MEETNFNIMDCALIAIATGEKAQNLRELRDYLKNTHPGCLYYHFWGARLHSHFDDMEFQNDFAIWTSRKLNDSKISEQLSLIDPNIYKDMEELRTEVIEIIEQQLYELEYVPWAKRGQEFHFIRSQIVIFDTGVSVNDPKDLLKRIPEMSIGSIFYHFIDSRRRLPDNRSDFSVWLDRFRNKYTGLIKDLDMIDPYFTTLNELRQDINTVFINYFEGGTA